MKTQPRNLSMGYNRPKLLDPGNRLGQHNSPKALVVKGGNGGNPQSLEGNMGWCLVGRKKVAGLGEEHQLQLLQ